MDLCFFFPQDFGFLNKWCSLGKSCDEDKVDVEGRNNQNNKRQKWNVLKEMEMEILTRVNRGLAVLGPVVARLGLADD